MKYQAHFLSFVSFQTLQAGGGSPLKFNFLTLDKLKEGDADLFNFKVFINVYN